MTTTRIRTIHHIHLMHGAGRHNAVTSHSFYQFNAARTISDLESREKVETEQVIEAIGYRTLDRKLWRR